MLMVIFLLGIALLMLMIIKFKINPFLALIGTSILIGFGARLPLSGIASGIASGFGSTMTSVGIVIALGIILGQLLYETGGTEEIAKADTVTAKLPKSPPTGDTSNLMLWIALLFISGGACTALTVKRKKMYRHGGNAK